MNNTKNKELDTWDTMENMVKQKGRLGQMRYDMFPESFLIRSDQMDSGMFSECLAKIKAIKVSQKVKEFI